MPASRLVGNSGFFAVEDEGNLHDIAAINLAFSCGVDVALLPSVGRASLRSLPRDLHDWSGDPSHHAYQAWKRRVRTALRGIDLNSYGFATFFTTGLPYGLFLGNPIPCSHVLKDIDAGVMISNAIEQEYAPDSFGSTSSCFHLNYSDLSRRTKLEKMFERSGFRLKLLLGSEATVMNLSDFGADYLRYPSHLFPWRRV